MKRFLKRLLVLPLMIIVTLIVLVQLSFYFTVGKLDKFDEEESFMYNAAEWLTMWAQ